ncbi:MAG TPA: NPCBM/NEW2 domain-containing protein, partial [Candidatus Sabulitectum sp.]|nr:NPCBM/NEW2 domain-containing protein [Candidatus Sabulitectum sp.]
CRTPRINMNAKRTFSAAQVVTLLWALLLLPSVTVDGRTIFLDELPIEHMTAGWGQAQRNLSIQERPLTIAGKTFQRGVGTHADSALMLKTGEQQGHFQAWVGVDDEVAGQPASIEFIVAADGQVVWESGVMRAGDPATVISSQGGVNFYIGSGPEADGFTSFAPPATGPGTLDETMPYVDNVWESSVRPLETGTAPSQVSAWWTRRTLEHIAGDPWGTLSLYTEKLLYMISPVAIPSNYDVYYCSRYSPVLRMLTGSPGFPVHGLLLWMLVPGALMAGALKVNERDAGLWAAVISAGVLPFFVTARFLLPAVPFLVILLAPRFLLRPRRALIAAPAGLAAGLALAFLTGHTVRNGGVNMAFHDGIAHYRQGQTEMSRALFLKAVDVALERDDGVDLNGTDALFNLGLISLRDGDPEGAETWWTLALERDPGYLPAARALLELRH